MSRRETLPTRRGSVGSKNSRTPTKKFASRSDELCDWMQSLGYQIPKHIKPEHFDYLFQNEETARIVRNMMKEIKPGNVLSREEMAKFEKLKNEGRVLYGAELEGALNRIKNIQVEKARKDRDNIERELELDRAIARKKEEIRKLKAIDQVLGNAMKEAELEEDKIQKSIEEFERKQSERLDNEIVARQEELSQLGEALHQKLREVHLSVASGKESTKQTYRLCDTDWLNILEEEEKLNAAIRSMFDKYGHSFLRPMGGGGGGDPDFVDPLISETMYRTFKQHENSLERLKHLIIHEKIRELDLDLDMAGSHAKQKNLQNIVEVAKQLYRTEPAIRERMIGETLKKCDLLDTVLRREKSSLHDSLMQDTSLKLNSQVKEIVDLRTSAKKRQQDFMSFLVNSLVNQRVRVDLIRELVRAEKLKNEKFAWELQEYRTSMFELSKKEENIQNVLGATLGIDPEVEEAMIKYKIPISAYLDPRTQYQTLGIIKALELEERNATRVKSSHQLQSHSLQLGKQLDQLELLSTNLKVKFAVRTPLDEAVASVETVHKEMSEKLDWHAKNKERLAKEAVIQKMDKLQEITGFLAKLKQVQQHPSNES